MRNIIAENIVNATITASSETPSYEFSDALIDSRLSRVGRTLDDAAEWILFSFVSSVDVDTVCIFGGNMQSGATVKIQANATDSWTSPSVDQALTYTKDNRLSRLKGRDVGTWSYTFSSTQSYQYWRLYVDDSTNPDEYIEIGFMFMDENVDFPGMNVNQVFTRNTTSEVDFSPSGQAYGIQRTQYNTASFSYPNATETQKTNLDIFFNKTDIVTPYCMIVWENNLDVQRPLYVVNTSLPEWQRVEQTGGVVWRFNMAIREVF